MTQGNRALTVYQRLEDVPAVLLDQVVDVAENATTPRELWLAVVRTGIQIYRPPDPMSILEAADKGRHHGSITPAGCPYSRGAAGIPLTTCCRHCSCAQG